MQSAADTSLTAFAADAARVGAAIAIGFAIAFVLAAIGARIACRAGWLPEASARRVRRPFLVLLPLLAVQLVLASVGGLGEAARTLVRDVVALGVIAAVVWTLVEVIRGAAAGVVARHDITAADNLDARRVHTQITVLSRTLVAFVIAVGIATALMTFPRVRELGASLLVSAGFAGLAIGLAARPVLENLIAGLQLAFTQPIRIDDVIIVDGEWGWVEEITATYVVIRIWDQRRLIVPFSKFISEPFQNWTRRTSDLLGTVFVHADYTVPVQAVREELERLCASAKEWDGKVCVLQVTNATDRTVELRALVSARSSPEAWNLRVFVREKLIEYLQREHPECLPRARVELEDGSGRGARAGGAR